MGRSELAFIDLFAGAGGLSEGFLKNGYNGIAHLEMMADACKTLTTRAAFYVLKSAGKENIYYDYISGACPQTELISKAKEIDSKIEKRTICVQMREGNVQTLCDQISALNGGRPIDVVIGGPPCQAYSLVGRARKGASKIKSDPRNFLYKVYFEFIRLIKPRAFVFENVLGIETAGNGEYIKKIQELSEKLGYTFSSQILLARDFGVLQNRKRVIIFGAKDERVCVSFWRHLEAVRKKRLKLFKDAKVIDLLSDLPPLLPGGSCGKYLNKPSEYLVESGIRPCERVPLTWHVTRPIRELDREIYRIAIREWQKGRRLDYRYLPNDLRTHKNQTSFLDRFKVVEANSKACHTMVAHIAKDGHYYIYPNIIEARSLSVREAARIQSFPDDYYFEGSRTSAYTQIGNAVPPMLSECIAEALKEALKGENKHGPKY